MSLITAQHHLGRDTFHHVWDRDIAPELVVKPGDEVSLGLRDPSDYQITAATKASELFDLDPARMDVLSGPRSKSSDAFVAAVIW